MSFPRAAGIRLHPTSLPGGHGIGDLGGGAYRFVDFLAAAGMRLWQVLPLGPTGAGNSPYQALSSFAGNPLLISLDRLRGEGLLSPEDFAGASAFPAERVDYGRARKLKELLLHRAFENFEAGKGGAEPRKKFAAFCERESAWLDDFILFMSLKEHFHGAAWCQWPETQLVTRGDSARRKYRRQFERELRRHAFSQYLFFSQWRQLKQYAAENKVRIIGDLPIYVALDSADVWANPTFFKLDQQGKPRGVAGVPPDYFSATGQLWGNPIYNWEALEQDGYGWWCRRLSAALALVDILRLDHFRGFEAYWEVPAGENTAVNGKWVKGPGATFFAAVRRELGELPIIAEDLGVITPEVDKLRKELGIPGMKVLQFAFCEGADKYLPHTYERNCVVYTATHDNDTTRGWYEAVGPDYAHFVPESLQRERDQARRYLARDGTRMAGDFIRLAMRSVADMAVFPMQDVLDLSNEARMNRPGIPAGQWVWRLTPEQLERAPAAWLREMADLYGRRG